MFYRNLFNVPTWGFNRPFREFDRLRRQMDELYGALSSGAYSMPSSGVFPLTNVTEDGENYYVWSELPGIKQPVFLVWGKNDPVLPAAHAQRIAAKLPDVRVAVWDECGHLPFLEKQAEFLATARAFFGAEEA